jgi:hypothetical protein
VDQRAKGLRRRLGSLLRVIRSRADLSGPLDWRLAYHRYNELWIHQLD